MIHLLLWTAFPIFLAGSVVWILIRLWRVATIGPAYKAKILCSTIFVSGRDIDGRHAEEVSADSYWALRLCRSRIDRANGSVTSSLFSLRERTAIYRPGFGATLLGRGPLHALPIPTERPPRASAAPWPEGIASAGLKRVVESGFSEPDRHQHRRTRAIVVVRSGRIVSEGYAPGISADTRLPGWSMTKSVLGALVGILVGEGRLSLAGKELLPQWRAPDPRAEIRLEDLLRMCSGLRFSEIYSDLASDVVQMLFNCDDAAAYAASQPLTSPPGTLWSYSSGTTNILSAIVRRIVGEAEYPRWPRRALFDPIGMSSAILEPDASGTFLCSSFMLATARDWARFGQMQLQDGIWEGRRILPEGWVRFSTSPTPQSPAGIYGAHWWLRLQAEMGGEGPAAARIPSDAFFAVGHEGQTLTVIPSLQLVVVRLGLSIHIDAWNHAAFLSELLEAL